MSEVWCLRLVLGTSHLTSVLPAMLRQVKALPELLRERDRCRRELLRRDLRDAWARAFLAGAHAALEWAASGSPERPVAPSTLTRDNPGPEGQE